MYYFVHLKGFKPYNTMDKEDALHQLFYLRAHGFNATITKVPFRKAIHLIITRY